MTKGLEVGEICSLTSGLDLLHTNPLDRVGLPSLRMTDGPNGARGDIFGTSKATCFPCGAGQAATWDLDLVYSIGKVLAKEAKAKGAAVLLAPTVNIQRSPVGGRNFECFSEDPYLTAAMAVAFVEGVQAEGVVACIKHFVCNDYKTQRLSASSVVDERTLREIYLLPFEAAVRAGKVRAVMAAYNRLNGVFCTEHKRLLTTGLRQEWGFDGVVVSDWGAVHDGRAALKAGCDLEMPGPGKHMGTNLEPFVRDSSIPETEVRRAAERVIRMVREVEASGVPCSGPGEPESSEETLAHRELARRAASRSLILLKNDGILPLEPKSIRRLALIGAYAEDPAIQGGGSSQVRPYGVWTPLRAIKERALTFSGSLGPIEIRYARGRKPASRIASADPSYFFPIDEAGARFRLEYFESPEPSGTPVRADSTLHASVAWAGVPEGVAPEKPLSARWSGTLVPLDRVITCSRSQPVAVPEYFWTAR